MIDSISLAMVMPEIILLVMTSLIAIYDLFVASPGRVSTYRLTLLTLAVVAGLQGYMGASGQTLSGQIGKIFLAADGIGKKLTEKNTHNVIPASELQSWKKASEQITTDWVADVTAKGANGKLLLENARALIAKYAVK